MKMVIAMPVSATVGWVIATLLVPGDSTWQGHLWSLIWVLVSVVLGSILDKSKSL